jgi:hypothetical protein
MIVLSDVVCEMFIFSFVVEVGTETADCMSKRE